jgi:hypothetical protein
VIDDRLVAQRIYCPYCAEALVIQLDLSAGEQDYIEDCQVCCRPMQLKYASDDDGSVNIDVQCSD